MIERNDFLFELLTEELPPLALKKLSDALQSGIISGLEKKVLGYFDIHSYATPRRLAFIIKGLMIRQADQVLERKGPAVNAAFDENGQPTKAALGFAASCGVEMSQVQILKTDKGEWLYCKVEKPGELTENLLPGIIEESLKRLPIPKLMTWNDGAHHFARPVHGVLALFGKAILDFNLFGIQSSNTTVGHRFHHPDVIRIESPTEYTEKLRQAFVEVNFEKRKANIAEQLQTIADQENATAVVTDALLDEVTALVEWPVAVLGSFNERYLNVPKEVLILVMQVHQRYFALKNKEGGLLAKFVTMSNIASRDLDKVALGNQRVLHARFADAEFFYEADRIRTLESRISDLKKVVFEQQLGTLYDKTQRIKALAGYIAESLNVDQALTIRAAELSKTDLLTEMVGEFPELQGVMGAYYAKDDNESLDVAQALFEQYQPRFSGDELPSNPVSQCLALAERLDTLIGIIGIGKLPTGEKDPYALRRAAVGILRVLIEKHLNLDLTALLELAAEQYGAVLTNRNTCLEARAFLMDRQRFMLIDQGVSTNVVTAVESINVFNPYNFSLRAEALQQFLKEDDCAALVELNKRVANILKKKNDAPYSVNEELFEKPAEAQLYHLLEKKRQQLQSFARSAEYMLILKELLSFKAMLTQFFDDVMVFVDDEKMKANRIALLLHVRELFLLVGDISELQG